MSNLIQPYQGSDRRLLEQINPNFGGMPEREDARKIETVEQAFGIISEKMGDQAGKLDEIENKRGLSSGANESYGYAAEYDKFVSDNPLSFDKHEKFANKIAAKIRGINRNFTNPAYEAHFQQWKENEADSFLINATKKLKSSIKDNSKDEWQIQINGQIKRRDYAGAIATAQSGTGLFPQIAINEAIFDIQKKSSIDECDDLLIENPKQLFDKLHDGSLNQYLSPMEQEGYRRKIRSMAEDEGRGGFIRNFTRQSKEAQESGASKVKDDAPEFTGMFTEKECGWINAIRNGRAGEVVDDIQTEAILEARAFKPDDPKSPSMEIARAKFINKYGMFGLDKEFLNRQWSIAEAANKKLVTPTVGIDGILEDIREQGFLADDEATAKFRTSIREDDGEGWQIGGVMRERYMTIADIKDADNSKTAKEKYIASETKRISNDIQARISKSFLAWRDSTEEGQKATSEEQYEKIHSLVREVTGKKELILINRGSEVDASISAIRTAQNNKYSKYALSRGKEIYIDTRNQSEKPQPASLGYDKRPDLPEGILLPKQMMEGFDQENGVVEITFDNKRFRRSRVVGECEGDEPKMTYAVARQGGYNPDSLYYVKMSVRGGNTKEMMREQEADLGGMNMIKKENLSKPQSLQLKIGDMIIGNEARRDANGNLTVYKLPAGDGGGTHEIAGINNGSHPKEFGKLKRMLDSGDHAGAELEAQRYVMEYTQRVGDALDSAGVKSPGISYFLRDMYFNGGEYGAARVICRAIGIPDTKKIDGNVSAAIKGYLNNHTENELLDAIKDSRENLYRSIALKNSGKKKFLAGWINRNNRTYDQAKAISKQILQTN